MGQIVLAFEEKIGTWKYVRLCALCVLVPDSSVALRIYRMDGNAESRKLLGRLIIEAR